MCRIYTEKSSPKIPINYSPVAKMREAHALCACLAHFIRSCAHFLYLLRLSEEKTVMTKVFTKLPLSTLPKCSVILLKLIIIISISAIYVGLDLLWPLYILSQA